MSPPLSLTEVWENYQLARDCFRITKKILDERDEGLLSNTGLAEASIDDAERIIEDGRSGWDDFVILSLWAVFERAVSDFVRGKARILVSQEPRGFSQKFHDFVESQIEYWKIGDELDLLKAVVDANLIGQAKQIKDYRDWVVHKSRIPAANVPPIQAYSVLRRIASTISGL